MFKIRHILILITLLVALLAVAILCVNYYILYSTSDQYSEKIGELPDCDVALVLGTSSTPNGVHYNRYFYERMITASDLYHSCKVKHFILSGDNHKEGYNEPEDMKDLLMKLGVPREAMTLDYAGFRTLDSVVRAKKVFGQEKFYIVSQRFHIPRALYIANATGVETYGVEAQTTVLGSRHRWVVTREILARCKAFLDLYIFGVSPKYLGEPIKLDIS